MADKAAEALGQILSQARLSLDEAMERLRGGEALGTISSAQLQRMLARADNTSCTNTGCGGRALTAQESAKTAG
jgi:hypothetical protein